ncbi:uncharacterized protein LOC129311013 isoform X3 [Prosopis cineraria]|uniref:uncharacterized protein LOC129311013 isoform X3 n=1 Tax=Prosopis cineraria TaxID=364024 RepID=UPI00240ECEC3|nr:uncharacterized protein LOC129311013 isoform X3 [Prosopis cineraria]
MKKRGKSKVAMVDLLTTPSPRSSPPYDSPNSAIFIRTASISKNTKRTTVGLSKSQTLKTVSNVSELKDLASTRLDELKNLIDSSHSEILNNLEASQSRLRKRLKMQTQSCQQIMDEADKEYKKVSERIAENQELMKMHRSTHRAPAKRPLQTYRSHLTRQLTLFENVSEFRQPSQLTAL